MDPDPESITKTLHDIIPPYFDMEHTLYKENNHEKDFYFAYFNDANHSLVTGMATFNNKYELTSCHLAVTLLKNAYGNFKSNCPNLSLSELFDIALALNENDKFTLSYDGTNPMITSPYGEVTAYTVLEEALKEKKPDLMDINDQMVDYLCHKVSKSRLTKSSECFKYIENKYAKPTKAHIIKLEKAS